MWRLEEEGTRPRWHGERLPLYEYELPGYYTVLYCFMRRWR